MATPDLLVAMDGELHDQLAAIHSRWDAGSTLRLFVNDRDPTPEDALEDYDEPTIDGYAPVDLTAKWTNTGRDRAGQWTMQTEIFLFPVPTAGSPVTIHGFFVEKDGDVLCARRLDAPEVLSVGGEPYPLRVWLSVYSGLLHAELVT